MTILEILEAHQIGGFSSDGHNRVMTCSGCHKQITGQGLSLDDIIRAHQAEVLDKHMQEREAEAWDECDDAWEQAHKMSHHEPWEYMIDNPYEETE